MTEEELKIRWYDLNIQKTVIEQQMVQIQKLIHAPEKKTKEVKGEKEVVDN